MMINIYRRLLRERASGFFPRSIVKAKIILPSEDPTKWGQPALDYDVAFVARLQVLIDRFCPSRNLQEIQIIFGEIADVIFE